MCTDGRPLAPGFTTAVTFGNPTKNLHLGSGARPHRLHHRRTPQLHLPRPHPPHRPKVPKKLPQGVHADLLRQYNTQTINGTNRKFSEETILARTPQQALYGTCPRRDPDATRLHCHGHHQQLGQGPPQRADPHTRLRRDRPQRLGTPEHDDDTASYRPVTRPPSSTNSAGSPDSVSSNSCKSKTHGRPSWQLAMKMRTGTNFAGASKDILADTATLNDILSQSPRNPTPDRSDLHIPETV